MAENKSPSCKVAVIGAGNVGLLMMRTFLKKNCNVVCFEMRSNCGGMWNFHTTEQEKQTGYAELNYDGSVSCANSEVQLNTSKNTILPSDVLYDGVVKLPNHQWLTTKEFLEILQQSAVKYNLLPHIRFNTEVVRLDKEARGWKVTFKDTKGEQEDELFDFVVCCTGGYRFPSMPVIKDIDKFKGLGIHSCQVRLENELFAGKNVLVVGSSFSGTDMAYYSLKNGANKVYWSEQRELHKKNYWMIDRCPQDTDSMKPFDLLFSRQIWFEQPGGLLNYLDSLVTPIYRINNETLNIPADRLGLTDISYILEQEILGKLQKIGPVKAMTEKGVITWDGTNIDNIDIAVYSTGFRTKFPILDNIWPVENQLKNELYLHMLPTDEGLDGLAITGANEAYGSKTAIYELQARWLSQFWLTRKYDNEGRLFTKEETALMKKSVNEVRAAKPKDNKFNFIYDVFTMTDTLAQDIGCLPPDIRHLIGTSSRENVELGIALLKGPLFSMQYHIQGPDTFPNAGRYCVNVAKSQIGEKEFERLVQEAMEDSLQFYKNMGVKNEKYCVKPCFLSITKKLLY